MTDRIHSMTVVFEKPIREDDAEVYKSAFSLMKGVIEVEKNVADASSYAATAQARWNLIEKLRGILFS